MRKNAYCIKHFPLLIDVELYKLSGILSNKPIQGECVI